MRRVACRRGRCSARRDGAALGSREVAVTVAEVEKFALPAQDHRDQLSVAGQASDRAGGQKLACRGQSGAA